MSGMSIREALTSAVNAMDTHEVPHMYAEARVRIVLMLEQGNCGEISPGIAPLTDSINALIFG
jgi:hypothetical protein